MARLIVKRKSTRIDMTAMSDVTVLLLTFFMLTSTFVQKEPVQVTTPGSVSEIKIPEQTFSRYLSIRKERYFFAWINREIWLVRLKVWEKIME